MMVDPAIATVALQRIAAGLPAFESVAPNSLERARRRDALKWLRARGYLVVAETGERSYYAKGYSREIKLPRVTDDGRQYLASHK